MRYIILKLYKIIHCKITHFFRLELSHYLCYDDSKIHPLEQHHHRSFFILLTSHFLVGGHPIYRNQSKLTYRWLVARCRSKRNDQCLPYYMEMTYDTCLILVVVWQVQQLAESPYHARFQVMKRLSVLQVAFLLIPQTWLHVFQHLIFGCMHCDS